MFYNSRCGHKNALEVFAAVRPVIVALRRKHAIHFVVEQIAHARGPVHVRHQWNMGADINRR
jgi:hypothetical protein